jgi:hypothetical protein
MHALTTTHIDRPGYAWLAVASQVATAILAIPVGLMFIAEPDGSLMQLPVGWIEATVFGTYLIPGIFLVAMNGFGQLLAAGLVVLRHGSAPWLTGALGVGMIIWILVQLAVMPETMVLQWIFLAVGFVQGFIALFWLRRLGYLHLGRSVTPAQPQGT